MPGLQRYGAVPATRGRRLDRAVGRVEERADICRALIDEEAETLAVKADALGYIGGRAMQTAALISQMEQQLSTAVPMASGRVASIADITALALSGLVADGAARLRRI